MTWRRTGGDPLRGLRRPQSAYRPLLNDARFMRLLIIGGSDAGMSAAMRARELRPGLEIATILADSFPNYSICGLPIYISGETENWRDLARRTDFDGIELL